jgi:hypothetical protein
VYSTVLPDGIESGIQAVFWTVLAIFFVMVIVGWWVARKDWFTDEGPPTVEDGKDQSDDHPTDQV